MPALSGYQMFDESFADNPLINVVCFGMMKPNRFMFVKAFKPGWKLILFGAKTGRDGLGGAAFASGYIARDADDAGAVNTCVEGHPKIEAGLIAATLEMFERKTILACRDLGTAGLDGAPSEMCVDVGARIFADAVPLRDTEMSVTEILLSESQEQMLAEIHPDKVAEAEEICARNGLSCAVVGETTGSDRYVVEFGGEVVCDLPIRLLAGGAPEKEFTVKPYAEERPFVRPEGRCGSLHLRFCRIRILRTTVCMPHSLIRRHRGEHTR